MTTTLFRKSIFSILYICFSGTVLNAQIPQLRSVDCNRVNTGLSTPLYANITGANQYKFKVTNIELGVTDSVIKGVRSFFLNEIPTVSRYNCNYEVSVCLDNGSGFGSYGNICNPSSVALICKLRTVDCGRHIPITVNPFTYPLYASINTADSWDFQIRSAQNQNYIEDIFGLPNRMFQLSMASNLFHLFNREYQIRVRTDQGGIVQPWGPWCSVYTPFPLYKPHFPDLTSVSSAGRTIHNVSANQNLYILNNIGETITQTYTLYPGPGNGNPQTGMKILNQGFEQPSKWTVTMITPGKPGGVIDRKSSQVINVELHPNPFADHLTVSSNFDDKNILSLRIFNNQGQQIELLIISSPVEVLNLNHLSSGSYYFEFTNSNNELVEILKIIKSY